jgi:hypothetical protein
LQHRVIAASGFCSKLLGFLSYWVIAYRVYGISGFCISGYCLRGKISGFCHIGFLFKIARVFVISGYCISGLWHIGFLHVGFLLMLARVFVYRVIDIGFLTVGFLISGFDLEPCVYILCHKVFDVIFSHLELPVKWEICSTLLLQISRKTILIQGRRAARGCVGGGFKRFI